MSSNQLTVSTNADVAKVPGLKKQYKTLLESRPNRQGAALMQNSAGNYIAASLGQGADPVQSFVLKATAGQGQRVVLDIAENLPYQGATQRKSVPNDSGVKEIRMSQSNGKTRIVIELNQGYKANTDTLIRHQSILIEKQKGVLPSAAKKLQQRSPLAKETLDRLMLTYDDGPHANDVMIAKEALSVGAKVELFWNTQNLLTSKGKQLLSQIPADKTITEHFGSEAKTDRFIRDNMDPKKAQIAREVYDLAAKSAGRIKIGTHSTFHPHSQNKTVGGKDNAYKSDKPNFPSDRPPTVEKRYQLHPTSKEFTRIDKFGRTGREEDARFFEKSMTQAIGTSFTVKRFRLPGSSAAMAGKDYLAFVSKRGGAYVDFTKDSNDSNKYPDVKPREAFSKTQAEMEKNPKASDIYLYHSRTFQKGDISNMLPR